VTAEMTKSCNSGWRRPFLSIRCQLSDQTQP